ncbi:MAG: APC family permease [Planctomycetota bacterium]
MAQPGGQLRRELGLFHAVLLGLGSILGTGVFVSIGIAAGVAGPAVLVAIVLAALLALCNGLSSAQLAAAHPVAGGTYEYGYRYLNDKLGFTAGWMFLLAKSASAATAALAVSYYLTWQFVITTEVVAWLGARNIVYLEIGIALLALGAVMATVLCGIRRSNWVNAVLVSVTVAGLLVVMVFVFYQSLNGGAVRRDVTYLAAHWDVQVSLLAATALMFVAFTGYGRIATLGEEVRNPRRVIPNAIWITLAVSTVLYLGIGLVVVLTMGELDTVMTADGLAYAMYVFGAQQWLIGCIALAAITAMLGVLLNLILGLSRVALAMGRRGDLPRVFAKVNAAGTTPVPAVLLVAGIITGLTLVGDVKATWSFSAFTVLIYYGITNLACLRLPKEDRLYPRAFAWAGLAGCFFLAWWVEPRYWVAGCVLIVVGLFWQQFAQRVFKQLPDPREVCVKCRYDLRASSGTCPECGAVIPGEDAADT